jgi:transposase-like protein
MGQVTVLTGPERRRKWSAAEREAILTEAFSPGGVVADVARRFDLSTSVIYRWRNGCRAKPSGLPRSFSTNLASAEAGVFMSPPSWSSWARSK